MSYEIVDPTSVPIGRGPHPAASPFDRRISQALGVAAFEVYQVELPPGAETVDHDHVDDGVEDVYAILEGSGWLVVDGEDVPVRPGQFVAVAVGTRRRMRSGDDGLRFIAICAAP